MSLRTIIRLSGPQVKYGMNDKISVRGSRDVAECNQLRYNATGWRASCNYSWGITDLSGTNGLYVNGRYVLKKALRHGDEIWTGNTLLWFNR